MSNAASLLDLDPDLAGDLSGDRLELARRHLRVRVERVGKGEWRPEANAFGAQGGIGLLLTEGLLLRRVQLSHRAAAELLGPGDVLRPWQDDGEFAQFPFAVTFRSATAVCIGVLDRAFVARAAHFPEVIGGLVGRVMDRSRFLAATLAVAQLPSVEDRLLVELWQLAGRYGRVRRDGVVLDQRITHEMLGMMVGARRPSVTTALGRLRDRGLVVPQRVGWILTGAPPSAFALRGHRTEIELGPLEPQTA